MRSEEAAAAYALLATPGVGYVAAGRALRTAKEAGVSISELVGRSSENLSELLPVGARDCVNVFSRSDAGLCARFSRSIDMVHAAGGMVVAITDADYPSRLLRELGRNTPPVLCVLGNLALLEQELAGIVGARDASPESLGYAAACARHLAERGIGVVSGAARGIDETAHGTALEWGGSSVFALPHGILRSRGTQEIRDAVDEGRAVLISEFAPDAPWATHSAIVRNATVAAFSRILCVFEPRDTGGSVRTAEIGLAQAKPVLVHCLGSDYRVERRLVTSGARVLPVHDAAELGRTLERAWAAESPARREQQELF